MERVRIARARSMIRRRGAWMRGLAGIDAEIREAPSRIGELTGFWKLGVTELA